MVAVFVWPNKIQVACTVASSYRRALSFPMKACWGACLQELSACQRQGNGYFCNFYWAERPALEGVVGSHHLVIYSKTKEKHWPRRWKPWKYLVLQGFLRWGGIHTACWWGVAPNVQPMTWRAPDSGRSLAKRHNVFCLQQRPGYSSRGGGEGQIWS